ncbi:MAG: SDR family oxidoreductase [Acidobacteriota bacterium]
MIDPHLASRSVLVTGGNSGIGEAIAKAFAAQGARLILHFLDAAVVPPNMGHAVAGRAKADAIAAEIRARGGSIDVIPGDLLDPATPRRLFDGAGPVDILVNNAAHCELPDDILGVTPESLDRHFAVNARASAAMMAEFVRRFRAREGTSGRIVNVSTDAARAFATQVGYGASKAALEAMTRSVAIEAGPFGITVNAVAPGPIQTGYIDADLARRVLPDIPLGCLGTPEDVAHVVVFLASEQARWITGQVIQVAGGHAL